MAPACSPTCTTVDPSISVGVASPSMTEVSASSRSSRRLSSSGFGSSSGSGAAAAGSTVGDVPGGGAAPAGPTVVTTARDAPTPNATKPAMALRMRSFPPVDSGTG